MASQTISGQRWADGTTVSLYLAAAWPDPTQAPSGTAVATAAVSGGAVTFTGLATSVRYVAYAGGLGVRFVVPQVNPMDARSLRARVDELSAEVGPATGSRLDTAESDILLRPLKSSLPYNARDYGAPGAGLVNETAGLQALLEAAAGGVAEIPKGTYKTTSAVGTATVASGSSTIASVAPTTGWVNGEPIHGAGIPTGTTIVSGAGTATMVLSQNATASASGVAVKTCLLVRPNTKVNVAKDALFQVTGTANAVEFYTPTARTPATGYSLAANAVESAEVVPLSAANAANFAVGNFLQVRDTYTLAGEACHRETNIIEQVVSASATATTASGSNQLTLVTPTTGWFNNMLVTGAGIPAGTTILSGAGTATLTMSANATASAPGVAITGSGLWLKYPVNYAYLASLSAAVSPVTPADNVHWSGGRFDLTGVVSNPGGADRNVFHVEWGSNCSVEDVTAINFPNKVVEFYAGVNSHQRRIVGWLPSAVGPGEGYVCRLTYSRDCTIRQAWGRSVRHTADLSGGSDCLIDTVLATGGVVSNQIAAFLHGLESKRHRVVNVYASNVETAFGAGNGTFGADFDFWADGIVAHRCDTAVSIINGCAGFNIRAKAKNSTIRAATVDNSTNGYLEMEADGIVTNPSSYGAITVSGTSADITVKPRIRNPIFKGITITATSGGGKITVLDPDIDMGTVNANGVDATTLVATSRILVRGGEIRMNNGSSSAVSLTGPAGSVLSVEGTQVGGTMLRCVAFAGGSTDQTVKGAKFRGTIGEQVRADAGTFRILGGTEFTSGVAIRTATSATSVTIGDVDLSLATTKLSNALGATVIGGEALRHTVPVQTISTDAPFTLTPTSSPEHTYFTAVMAANRAVTLSTTNAYTGARFRIVRTAASTGAFTLDIGTGPLKSLAPGQWAEVVYTGAAWVLSEFGSL